jgi:hypothetical protein
MGTNYKRRSLKADTRRCQKGPEKGNPAGRRAHKVNGPQPRIEAGGRAAEGHEQVTYYHIGYSFICFNC